MFQFYIKDFNINCDKCKKEVKASSNNQKYCKKCSEIVSKQKQKKYNKARYKIIEKICATCKKKVKERGMRVNCKSCIDFLKTHKFCTECKKVPIRKSKSYCTECLNKIKNQRAIDKYHRTKVERKCKQCEASLKGHKTGKEFCNDNCKSQYIIENTKTEPTKEEKPIINPFFLQDRGSKRRK